MFVVERREVGGETRWKKILTVNDELFDNKVIVDSFNLRSSITGKSYEWRIREIDEVGEKSLSSE